MVNGIIDIPLPGQKSGDPAQNDGKSESPFALEYFLAGPENRLVEAAVLRVLGEPRGVFNPLVLYGPTGSGKTHLAYGIASHWQNRHGRRSVVCTSAIDFAREYREALDTQAVDDFHVKYRKTSLVVIEDLDKLVRPRSTKEKAQEELIHTLSSLTSWGHQAILTASAAPTQIRGLLPGLQSRLTGGLCVPLLLPGPDSRQAILLRLAERLDIDLPDSAAKTLATGLPGSVLQLRGALTQLEAHARLDGGVIEPALVRTFLARKKELQTPPMRDIAAATARFFSLSLADLRSKSRRRAVVNARAVTIYLARQLTQDSFQQIGKYLGGRDHTTVMHSHKKVTKLLEKDPAIREAVHELQAKWRPD